MGDFNFIKNSANKAGQILGLNEWYDDLILLRIYKHLYYTFGGDKRLMYYWLQTENLFLEGIPANLIKTEQGISEVLEEMNYWVYRWR